jgi:hypothetical protein
MKKLKQTTKKIPEKKPGYSDKITRKKRAIGGAITKEIKDMITEFLKEKAGTIYNLKILLLEKLCEAIIDEERDKYLCLHDLKNHNLVYLNFRNNPGLYDYDLTKFVHYLILSDNPQMNIYNDEHQDIDYIIYTLKFVNNLYSLIKKDPKLNEAKYKFNTDQKFSIMDNDEPYRNREFFQEEYTKHKKKQEQEEQEEPQEEQEEQEEPQEPQEPQEPIEKNKDLLLSLLDSTSITSITNIKKDINAFLKEQANTVYNLKIELLDKLFALLVDIGRDKKNFDKDSKKYYNIYVIFDANKKLYDYDLNHFIHENKDDAYEDINEIIYLLKFMKNIYSLLKEKPELTFDNHEFKIEKRWQLDSDYGRPRDKNYLIKNQEQVDTPNPNKLKINFETIISKIAYILNNAIIALSSDMKDIHLNTMDEKLELIKNEKHTKPPNAISTAMDEINKNLKLIKENHTTFANMHGITLTDELLRNAITALSKCEKALTDIFMQLDIIKKEEKIKEELIYIVNYIDKNKMGYSTFIDKYKPYDKNYVILGETLTTSNATDVAVLIKRKKWDKTLYKYSNKHAGDLVQPLWSHLTVWADSSAVIEIIDKIVKEILNNKAA